MSDRIKGCTVVFTEDMRDDDAESLFNAIRMIKGVGDVTPSITTADDWLARQQTKSAIRTQLLNWIEAKLL